MGITIGALNAFQSLSDYGKNAVADTVVLNAGQTQATITAIGTGKQVKVGDLLTVFPILASDTAFTVPTTETFILNVKYFKPRVGFTEVTSTTTFSSPADIAGTALAINTQLIADNLGDYVEAVVIDTDKIRIQGKLVIVSFDLDATSTAVHGLPTGTAAYKQYYTVTAAATTVATTLALKAKVQSLTDTLVASQFTDLPYEIKRYMGESTGSTVDASLNPVEYKGNSKVVVQTEYGEGDATLSFDEMSFEEDNLDFIYNWEVNDTDPLFFSGATAVKSFTLTEDVAPNEVAIFGLHKKIDGGIIVIEAPRAKSATVELSFNKLAFRTFTAEFSLMTSNVGKDVMKILEI